MTRYNVFDQLAELTKLTKTERGYSKFVQTGDIGFYDYNRGYFDVDIYAYQNYDKRWFVRIWVGSIDDLAFGGWREVASKEDADVIVERIAHEVFEHMIAFPLLSDLNTMLSQYNIAVKYE